MELNFWPICVSFTAEGDEDDDDDENEAGPPGEYEEEDDEDDGASDLGEGEEEEEVGLSYLMKEEIQVKFVNSAKCRKQRKAPVGFCGYGKQFWYSSQSTENSHLSEGDEQSLVAINWSHKLQDRSKSLGPGQVLPSDGCRVSMGERAWCEVCVCQQHPRFGSKAPVASQYWLFDKSLLPVRVNVEWV